jgi:hypothetical protein
MLFLVSCCDGTNRAGSMYRFAACEMLYSLKPERLFLRLNDEDPEEAAKKRALSRTFWGMFIFEW